MTPRRSRRTLVLACLLALAGCGSLPNSEAKFPEPRQDGQAKPSYEEDASIFGPGGLSFGGGDPQAEQAPGIGVNSFLWRASLDTVSFMPLVSADPFGGVIITDWYSPPETPNQRFKVNVFILGRALRADGVRVSVFRQQLDGTAGWVDARVEDSTAMSLENAILTRARQMRIAQAGE